LLLLPLLKKFAVGVCFVVAFVQSKVRHDTERSWKESDYDGYGAEKKGEVLAEGVHFAKVVH
jgi:hypothetical protein